MNTAVISAGFFQLLLEHSDSHLIRCNIQPLNQGPSARLVHPLAREVQHQVQRYLSQSDFTFELPLAPAGTEFQRWVWQQMQTIPAGEVRTYAAVAALKNSAARAVGGACRNNPLPLFIPCHRIVSSNGIGGYSGQWQKGDQIDIKRWLLKHEGWGEINKARGMQV